MSTEICTTIKYAYIYEVDGISNNVITMKPGYSLKKLSATTNQYTRESIDNDAGTVLAEKLEVASIMSEMDFKFLSAYPLILQLTFSDDTIQVMGSLNIPARFDSGTYRIRSSEFVIKRRSDLLKS